MWGNDIEEIRRLRKRKSAGVRLSIEGLEDRCLLSAGSDSPLQTIGGLARFGSADEYRAHIYPDAHFDVEAMIAQYRGSLDQRWQVTADGWWGGNWRVGIGAPEVITLAASPADASVAVATGHSETNTQEQGVDEGDLVETDGKYLYLLRNNELFIIDADPAGGLTVLSRTELEGSVIAQYLNGDRLTIVSSEWSWRYALTGLSPFRDGPKVTVSVFDVSDPTAPIDVQQTTLDGSYISSRAIGDQLYVSLDSYIYQPVLPGPEYRCTETECTYESEVDYGRRLSILVCDFVGSTDLRLPWFRTESGDGTIVSSGPLSEATDIYYDPDDPYSYSRHLLSVVAIDTAGGDAGAVDSATFSSFPSAHSVYASEHSFYIVGTNWFETGEESRIYKVGLNGNDVEFQAMGEVTGRVLNQFSMDEEGEYFRIATTTGWGLASENHLFVMRETAGALEVAGSVENLAPGERIFSARFMEDRAFVVTFRQVDPLFAIDLSDPTAPRVAGELHIPGFSGYLQAIDDQHLLGIGRDRELQVSLFDVSDLSRPSLLDRYFFSERGGFNWSFSEAEYDHHAFSYFPEYQTLAIPVSVAGSELVDSDDDGLADSWTYHQLNELRVLKIDVDHGIGLLGRIEHDGFVRRSLRIEDLLYSISDTGVKVNRFDDPNTEVTSLDLPLPVPVPDPIVVDLGRPVTTGLLGAAEFVGADLHYVPPTNSGSSLLPRVRLQLSLVEPGPAATSAGQGSMPAPQSGTADDLIVDALINDLVDGLALGLGAALGDGVWLE